MASPLSRKIQDGPLSHLKSFLNTLGYVTGKVSATVFVQRLNFVTLQLQEMEREDEISDELEIQDILSPTRYQHELSVWKGFVPKVKAGVFFELNVTWTFYLLDDVACRSFSAKVAKSLTKPVPASAVRKSLRASIQGWSTGQLASKVFSTTVRAQSMYWSALFIVSVAFDAISSMNLKSLPTLAALFVPRSKIEGNFLRRSRINFIRCTLGCFLTGVGAALGTLLRPGLGTTVGMIVMPQLVLSIR